MSSHKRDPKGAKKESKNALLDELDSLKGLLDEEAEEIITAAPWEFTPTDEPSTPNTLPELDAPEELTLAAKASRRPQAKPQPAIPVLEEVAFAENEPTDAVPELKDIVASKGSVQREVPDRKELLQLIEMLVQRRLDKLKPILTKEMMLQLERLYPALKKR